MLAVAGVLFGVGTSLLITAAEGPLLVAAGALASAGVALALTGLGAASEANYRRRNRYVFLSYALEDRERVADLIAEISAAGFTMWDPEAELLPGDRLGERVQAGLTDARAVVVFLSEHLSPWVAFEVGRAQGLGKTIVPVVVSPEGRFAARELAPEIIHLDASVDREGAATKLIQVLRRT